MTANHFFKMNGLGNDFVVLDARGGAPAPGRAQVQAIADRRSGIGCDQLIVLEQPRAAGADVFMRIFNADGSQVDACGNASRCVAALLAAETGRQEVAIETNAGLLLAQVNGNTATVDMGVPRFDWQQIPLSEAFADTTGIELQVGPIDAPILHTPSVVNVGNPHAVFWVADVDDYDLGRIGPLLEYHPIFPQRANISLAQVITADRIRLRVWERGAGLTRACGTAACAVAVAAARKGLCGREVTVELPGGPLQIHWREGDDHMLMTGPWALEASGELPDSLAEAAA